VTLSAPIPQMTPAMSRPVRIGCCAELAEPGWRWIVDQLGSPPVNWQYFSTQPRSALERVVKKPALSRYRACRELARGARSGKFDLIVTHLPLATCWSELFCGRRRRCPHVAFAFNFTTLPTGIRLRLMRRAFATVDRFVAFSSFERTLYSEHFGISPARIDVIPWRIRDPRSQPASMPEPSPSAGAPALARGEFISAVGSQGRDYATLLDAMRRLPGIALVLVASPENLRGLSPPPNVEVRQHIPLAEAENIIRRSRFVVVPLRDSRTACGHVTIVYSMFAERAIVATESAALAEYVIPDRNGVFVPPHDATALAGVIERLWNDSGECRRLGAAGRELALAQCLESQTVDYFRGIVEQVRSTGKL
jgi:glycosyltransferase involved in cell wall biosynthesis